MPLETPKERANRFLFLCNSKDPEAVRCRLFISGIRTEAIHKPNLISLFSTFGRVYDLSVHTGYLFVQYDNLQSATLAVDKLNTTTYKGATMSVKLAEKGKKAEIAEKEVCRFHLMGTCMRGRNCFYMHVEPNKSSVSKMASHSGGLSGHSGPGAIFPLNTARGAARHMEPGRNASVRFEQGPRASAAGAGLPPPYRPGADHKNERGFDRDRQELGQSGDPSMSSARPLKRPLPEDFDSLGRRTRPDPGSAGLGRPAIAAAAVNRHDGFSTLAGGGTHRPIPEPPLGHRRPSTHPELKSLPRVDPTAVLPRRDAPPVDLRPPYDCVIIAGNDMQRGYCNLIEKRLIEFGMLTNVQVVAGEHLLKRAVEEAARHGVPYTICATANNEEHRSLTLNILHGVVQEHRNMPLEDAMPFLSRNFDNFVELMKKKISAVNEWIPPKSKVAYIMNLLADGRRATLSELMDVDDYVQATVGRMKSVEASSNTGITATRDASTDRFRVGKGVIDSPLVGKSVDRRIDDELLDERRGLLDRDGGLDGRGSGLDGRGSRSGGIDSRGVAQRAQLLPEPGRDGPPYDRSREPEYGLARGSGLAGDGDRFQTSNGATFGIPSQSSGDTNLRFESSAVRRALNDILTASRSTVGQAMPPSQRYPY